MSGVAVKILAADVLARLQGMEERGGNLTGVMRFFGGYMVGSIQKNFDAEGRPIRWQPLAASTLGGFLGSRKSFRTKTGALSKKGREAAAGRQVLTATARLRRSIAPVEITPRGITIGANPVYAAIHQFGGMAGRGRKVAIPARPYLVFQDEDIDYFERVVIEYIMTRRML